MLRLIDRKEMDGWMDGWTDVEGDVEYVKVINNSSPCF
jgi:hypothetical protein